MKLKTSDLLNLSAVFLALPYFAGFIYLHAYYDFFGVSVSELGLNEAYIYINAFSFVARSAAELFYWERFEVLLLVTTIVILTLLALGLRPTIPRFLNPPNFQCVVSGYILIFVAIYFVAKATGEDLAESNLDELQPVLVFSLEEAEQDFYSKQNLVTAFNSYFFLFASEQTYFVVRRKVDGETFSLLRFPRSEMRIMSVVQDL